MSFSGNFLTAQEALHWGLVNRVVPHDDLLTVTRQLAADIAGNDPTGVRQIRATYAEIAHNDGAWDIEARDSGAWRRSQFDPAKVAERRAAITERGRGQGG
jgi:enoyl-CoA hydratase